MPKEMYACSTMGAGIEFVTPYAEVAQAWQDSNRWNYYTLVPVKVKL